jgi:hypothetical protein
MYEALSTVKRVRIMAGMTHLKRIPYFSNTNWLDLPFVLFTLIAILGLLNPVLSLPLASFAFGKGLISEFSSALRVMLFIFGRSKVLRWGCLTF